MRLAALVAVLAATVTCYGDEPDQNRGRESAASARAHTIVIAAASGPSSLLPPFAVDLVAGQLCDLIYQRLAEPIPGFSTSGDRDYRPRLASSWAWGADSQSIAFTLDSAARWHDGRPVTSRDVQFTYRLHRNPAVSSPRATALDVVDSVSAPDTHTAVVWVSQRLPTLFHDVTYPIHILPAHLLDTIPPARLRSHPTSRMPIGSGPFRFVGWTPATGIELVAADSALEAPSNVRRVLLRVLQDYQAALLALEVGEADVIDYVRPDDVPRLTRSSRLAMLRLPGYSYAALQFNLGERPGRGARLASQPRGSDESNGGMRGPPPLFGDVRMRRAVAMSIDRAALVANLLDSLGYVSIGPVTRAQVTADTTLVAPLYDPTRARALLDSLGWRLPPGRDDDVRRKDGRRLVFELLVPGSSATRVRAAVLVQHMLDAVGVQANIQQYDSPTLVTALDRGDFDAALMAFRVDANPASVRDLWGGEAGRSGHGFNFGGYASARTDALLDSAGRVTEPARSRAAYREAYQQILNDVPAVFLYEPVAVVAFDRRLVPVGVRADAWWAELARWRVSDPAGQR